MLVPGAMEDLDALELAEADEVLVISSSPAKRAADSSWHGGTAKRLSSAGSSSESPLPLACTPPSKIRRAKSNASFSIEDSGSRCDGEDNDSSCKDKKEPCRGCSRNSGDLVFGGSEQLRWGLPDQKGRWCRDCLTCWRTCFQQIRSLAMMSAWLDDGENNWQEWVQKLVAFLSLVAEGTPKITKTVVDRRSEVLAWGFAFLGVPFGTFVVERLSDRTGPVNLANAVQLFEAGKPRVGLLRAANLSTLVVADGATAYSRHAGSAPRWPMSLNLQTSDEERPHRSHVKPPSTEGYVK